MHFAEAKPLATAGIMLGGCCLALMYNVVLMQVCRRPPHPCGAEHSQPHLQTIRPVGRGARMPSPQQPVVALPARRARPSHPPIAPTHRNHPSSPPIKPTHRTGGPHVLVRRYGRPRQCAHRAPHLHVGAVPRAQAPRVRMHSCCHALLLCCSAALLLCCSAALPLCRSAALLPPPSPPPAAAAAGCSPSHPHPPPCVVARYAAPVMHASSVECIVCCLHAWQGELSNWTATRYIGCFNTFVGAAAYGLHPKLFGTPVSRELRKARPTRTISVRADRASQA